MKRFVWSILILAALQLQPASAQETPSPKNPATQPLYFKVQLDGKVRFASLKPGDVVEGALARDIYSPNRKVFAAGDHVRLTVDHLERKRKAPNNRWPWLVKIFLPRNENSPVFTDATISASDGSQSLLHVSLLSTAAKIEVGQSIKKKGSTAMISPASGTFAGRPHFAIGVVAFEAPGPDDELPSDLGSPLRQTSGTATIPAGTVCRILLLNDLLSSRNRAGDSVRARLLEPIILGSHLVVPAGSLLAGKVEKASPPRWLSRAGSLSLAFTSITLPDGDGVPITASVVGVELNRGSHTKLDAEGHLHGEKPGVAWMLIDGGVTAGLAKEVDDGTQLVIEAILSGATDASTAGTARIAGSVVSGIFMLTRHGRDVVLPNHTEMEIVLDRPVTTAPEKALATIANP